MGRLVLADLDLGLVLVERLELEVSDFGTDPGITSAERFQRRRTRLRTLVMRIPASALAQRVEEIRRPLAGLGITGLAARLNDGFLSIRVRAADGLAAADLTFRILLVHAGTHLRAVASDIRLHGHLPTPGPVLADRVMAALLGATDAPNVVERPHARGLCDVEIDLVAALLWQIMPRAGWRLPASNEVEVIGLRLGRSSIEVAYGPNGSRSGDLGVRPHGLQLASAHDLMHSADQLLRSGHIEDAMRGYRGLLAAGGPDQPHLIERILSLASARPAWFFDGLELARQALGRWPSSAAAHAALASITLAQGDAREAASHMTKIAQGASAEGDVDQAALAALAGARLLRVLEPKAATQLYELALEHDPGSAEAADALADRLADEQRWPELVRLLRARAVTAEPPRAVHLRLRLADVFAHHLHDLAGAQHELQTARELAPDDPAIHEMTASILASSDPDAAIEAWRQVARLAEARGDDRTCARAYAILGELLPPAEAEVAWRRGLELDPLQTEALAGLAKAAASRGDHAEAAELYERLRGLGLSQEISAGHELQLARSFIRIDRLDDARASLRRATMAGGETAAEAHAILAEIAEATLDREHAAAELETAICSFVGLASEGGDDRLYTRAAELAIARAVLLDNAGHAAQATVDWERAHDLASSHSPGIARDAARTMLSRVDDAVTERRWIDAVLATRPPAAERATLLVQRADVRRRENIPDLAAAVADLHEGLALLDSLSGETDAEQAQDGANQRTPESGAPTNETRRRAYQLEADLLANGGDPRARAQALSALARMAERSADRVEVETAAAAAWLAADEPAAALPHGARAHAELAPGVPAGLRREVLTTLGEAAWRQRAWPDVIRAYRGLTDDPGSDPARLGMSRYRLAVAADRSGDAPLALATLKPLVDDPEAARATVPEVRAQALRLYADLAERAGDLVGAATALEGFAEVATDSTSSARADAMYRAGELFRRADRGDDAVRCLEGALRISETHLPALDALEHAWRERGDLERVAVILGRKVAATARHPQRQKSLISRLGDLQDGLGRPEVALATHERALEIDPMWRPSLRYVTMRLRADGDITAAVQGLAKLAGELPGDSGVDLVLVVRERLLAVNELAKLTLELGPGQLDAARAVAQPALERAAQGTQPRATRGTEASAFAGEDASEIATALARLRGEATPRGAAETSEHAEDLTPNGRVKDAPAGALSLRDAALRARAAGKLQDALASLEAANQVSPGDVEVLRDLVELATESGDHEAAARHLATLADHQTGVRRADSLAQLADLYYDKLEDPLRARSAMRAAADAYGGTRRDGTLRMLGTEAAAHLAWDVVVDALSAIADDRRTIGDLTGLATALQRAGKLADAVELLETATEAGRFDDGGKLLAELRKEVHRKAELAWKLEQRAKGAPSLEASAMRTEAESLWQAIGRTAEDGAPDAPSPAVVTSFDPDDDLEDDAATAHKMSVAADPQPGASSRSQKTTDRPASKLRLPASVDAPISPKAPDMIEPPSVVISATPAQAAQAVAGAAAAADRNRLLAAHHDHPDDPGILLALLANLGNSAPELRRQILDHVVELCTGRAQAIALHELAVVARSGGHDPIRAAALWTKAHRVDPTYPPVWMPLADALVDADELELARDLYEKIAHSDDYDPARRHFASERARALDRDDSIVSGELGPRSPESAGAFVLGPPPRPDLHPELVRARELARQEAWPAAIEAAERAATALPEDTAAIELLEQLYLEAGDLTAASEAIGRQLVISENPQQRALLWRRRAKLYRDALGREAEAYRCLKEAHACAPADPEVAYQLRIAAMVRGEWALAASLLYREIAVATSPRDRGALHLELALIYEERLEDPAQAQVNYEQALAFDPTIPAVKSPLGRRYEAIGKYIDAARLYEEAAVYARAGDRAALIAAAARSRASADEDKGQPELAAQLDRAEAAGNLDASLDLAHQLWRAEPGHPAAFRVLSNVHRASADLVALTELTTIRASRAEAPEERAGAWLEVARLAEDTGKLDQAARAFDLALIEDPGHIGALDSRGALAFRLEDWATADLIYRDLAPGESVLGDDELALRRSVIAEKLGRDGEALNQALAAAATAPGRRDVMVRVQELATRVGDLPAALSAARAVLDLVPLDDADALLATHFALVDLQRQSGDLEGSIVALERIVRDHPLHRGALEQLADVHVAKGDWQTATRYLYQLVPLAATPSERAERLYRLGDVVLIHLGDIDRADDVFLRASDLDPSHVPTLRRLLDVYWRADDPAALVEVATELATAGGLANGPVAATSLARALVAASLLGDVDLAGKLVAALGEDAPRRIATALTDLIHREGRLELKTASTAIAELGRRGVIDLHKVRAAASGTPVAEMLVTGS